MTFLMFSIAARICFDPSACSFTALVTCSVAEFMAATVSSTSEDACDCLPVAAAIWPISSLERETDSMMFRSAAPALSASEHPGLGLGGAGAGHLHRVGRVLLDLSDDLADLLGRLDRALGQLADLVGDDGEAPAGLAGAGRLDGGVQGEEVGLVRDLLDDLEDAPDLVRALAETGDDAGGVLHVLGDGLHAVDGAGHRLAAGLRVLGGAGADAVGLGGDLRHLGDRPRHLRHGGAGTPRRLAELLRRSGPPRR